MPGRVPSVDGVHDVDVVVVGSGIAGLAAALGLASQRHSRRVAVLTKTAALTGGSSALAQGGIAVALGEGDSPRAHAADTLAVSGGIGDRGIVGILTREGPARVRRLIELGARFDRDPDGQLHFGREAAHGRARILHAAGDATGAEIVRAFVAAVLDHDRIELRTNTFARDVVREGERVHGVIARGADGRLEWWRAPEVVLATGGIGQLFSRTTNPPEVTGDGLAMAARAGARLVDLEFVQFHPTALAAPGADPLPLLTEALRGEGAILVDAAGRRFMPDVHPDAELAPRDVVARAIHAQIESGRGAFLDARACAFASRSADSSVLVPRIDASAAAGGRSTSSAGAIEPGRSPLDGFAERFPTVLALALAHGVDPRREPMPVSPAAHYHMGGILVDADGRTSVSGLWACGEAASTGAHGANRLASNSLLEGLVFGARLAEAIVRGGRCRPAAELDPLASVLLDDPDAAPRIDDRAARSPVPEGRELAADAPSSSGQDLAARRTALRAAAWQGLGLVRDGESIAGARRAISDQVSGWRPSATREALELESLALVGQLVGVAAALRTESRGSHFRRDHPASRPEWRRRLVLELRGGRVHALGLECGGDDTTGAGGEIDPSWSLAAGSGPAARASSQGGGRRRRRTAPR